MDKDIKIMERERFRNAPKIVAFVILLLFVAGLLALLISEWNSADVRTMVMQHFTVIVGLPAAGMFAFLVVALFESTYGNIEFSAVGLTFKGAAGPIVLWVLSLLAIVISIRLLW